MDSPPGTWGASLVGPWWPQQSTAAVLRDAEKHWGEAKDAQRLYAQSLKTKADQLARNTGATADDLINRFFDGKKFHDKLEEKYDVKQKAFEKGANSIEYLRDELTRIANDGSAEIDKVMSQQISPILKLAKIGEIQLKRNNEANSHSMRQIGNIAEAVGKILAAEGLTDASKPAEEAAAGRKWMRENGLNTDKPANPRPISADDLAKHDPAFGEASGHETTATNAGHSTSDGEPAFGNASGSSAANSGAAGTQPGFGEGSGTGGATGGVQGATVGGVPVAGGGSKSPAGGGVPSLGGHGLPSPVAGLGEAVSPESLGKSFTSGVQAGQPLAAGAHSLSSGTVNAVEAVSAPPPPAAPVAPASSSSVVAPHVESVSVEHGSVAPGGVSGGEVSAGAAPVTAVVAAPVQPVAPGPVVGGAVPPAGPLPLYGSDLRPPVVAPPAAVPSVGPVSGAPVASPSSVPSAGAGAPLVSAVDRGAAGGVAGQSGSGAGVGAAAMASAAAGAGVGEAAGRAAEEQYLQLVVNAVARQERGLVWAAGLREDSRKPLVVTDLAGGWIPPHVRLPSNVVVLAPAVRRCDAGVDALLGSTTVSVVYRPHGYIGESGSDDPALTGERARDEVAPKFDELRPRLMDAVKRLGEVKRIVQIMAGDVTRGIPVLDNDWQQFREYGEELRKTVVAGKVAMVGAWMAVAAVDALRAGHEGRAGYHLAWCETVLGGPRW